MFDLSIIVPVYNCEKYLKNTVQFVLNQSYSNFELLLIDDGSTDNSLQICNDAANKDKRVVVIHKENGGVSSARNCGIDAAKGSYIAFVDADDCIDSCMYERMISTLKLNCADFVCCRVVKEKEYKPVSHIMEEGIQNDCPLSMLSLKDYTMDSIVNKVFTRNIIGETRFDETITYSEDKLFVFDIILKATKMILLPNTFYHYIQHENSLSWEDTEKTWDGNFQVNKRIYEKIMSLEVDESLRRSVFRGYAKSIIALLRYDIKYRREKAYNEILASYSDVINTFLKMSGLSLGKWLEYKSYTKSYFCASLFHYYLKGKK